MSRLERFGDGWSVPRRAVRPKRVVLFSPPFDQGLRFPQRVEDLSLEQLVSQLSVERLDVTVLPGASRLDEESFDVQSLEPIANGFSCEFRSVVGADVLRSPSPGEQFGESMKHVAASKTTSDIDREALSSEFVNDDE